jgi:hypothetical protein
MEPEQPVRAIERSAPAADPDPKALACYGLLVSCPSDPARASEQVWLRFVAGRPVSGITTQFLDWCCDKLAAMGKTALLMPWDNAPWHVSHLVQDWIHEHNRTVKQTGQGVRIIACPLPTKSPWLNPIEPHWMHGKRAVAAPGGLLSADELAERVCSHFQCTHEPHLALTDEEP